jgi:hypothetical protein
MGWLSSQEKETVESRGLLNTDLVGTSRQPHTPRMPKVARWAAAQQHQLIQFFIFHFFFFFSADSF